MVEDSDINELYSKFKVEGNKPNYFIAFKLDEEKV